MEYLIRFLLCVLSFYLFGYVNRLMGIKRRLVKLWTKEIYYAVMVPLFLIPVVIVLICENGNVNIPGIISDLLLALSVGLLIVFIPYKEREL